jgi:uncharacterized protein with NRDE domain
MCTLALYLRQFEDYPVVIAANRDEHFSRPTEAPKIWPGDPSILAGKDLTAGGTWLGVNSRGLTAGIVNRRIQIETKTTPRSRGLLCLDILQAATMAEAPAALPYEDAGRYQPFLVLVAGAEGACAAYNSASDVERLDLASGLHVFSNTSFTEENGKKLDRARELFTNAGAALAPLLQETASLDSAVGVLHGVLGDHTPVEASDPRSALCVHTPGADYGTVSSSIIFCSRGSDKFDFYYAPGPPCRTEYYPAPSLPIL